MAAIELLGELGLVERELQALARPPPFLCAPHTQHHALPPSNPARSTTPYAHIFRK